MPLELFANLPHTTVSSGGTTAPAGGTSESWTVVSSSPFPAASNSATPATQFHVSDPALNTEIIAVTNVSGTTWTVTRGAEGTTPVAHTGGFTVFQVVSAGGLGAFPQWFNVRSVLYGAKGNGSADDTAAVQAAINAANSAGGGVVYFPAGTYKLTSALTVFGYITLLGDGDKITVISQSSTSANCLSGTDVTQLSICGLKLLGPGSGTGKGISFTLNSNTNTGFLDFRDTWVHGFGSDGIAINTPIVSAFTRVVSESNGGNGWTVTSSTSGTSCTWNSCYANANTGYGYSLSAQAYSAMNACAADGNANAYLLTGCQSVALNGCGAESTTTDNFILTGGYGNTLISPRVYANAHYGIHLTGSEHVCTIIGAVDNTPAGGAVNFIITDSGTTWSLLDYSNTTANSLGGTGNVLNDGGGDMTLPGDLTAGGTLKLNSGATIQFGGSLDTDLYRLAANSLATDGLFTAFGGVTATGNVTGQLFVSSLTGGGRVSQGSGAPSKPNSVNPVAGDIYFRTDTPTTANQRIYICTTGGGSPVWSGIA